MTVGGHGGVTPAMAPDLRRDFCAEAGKATGAVIRATKPGTNRGIVDQQDW